VVVRHTVHEGTLFGVGRFTPDNLRLLTLQISDLGLSVPITFDLKRVISFLPFENKSFSFKLMSVFGEPSTLFIPNLTLLIRSFEICNNLAFTEV